jgi:hypothetical protein
MPSSSAGEASSATQTAWEWEAEPSEDHSHVREDVPPVDGPGNGEAIGGIEAVESPVEAVEDSEAAEPVDPCALVTEAEWADWSGGGTIPVPQPLEGGDACGWIDAADELRLAIGAFPVEGDVRWLSEDEAATATAVTGTGDEAWWLEGWPVGQSSTLVVEAGAFDVVIEMSALATDQERLLEGALHFANLALERLP